MCTAKRYTIDEKDFIWFILDIDKSIYLIKNIKIKVFELLVLNYDYNYCVMLLHKIIIFLTLNYDKKGFFI